MAIKHWIVDTDTTITHTWDEYDAMYTSLEASMADAYDLVTATDSLVIDCIDSSGGHPDTTAVTVDGWTTDADHTLTIQAHKSQRHGGVWNDNYYRLECLLDGTNGPYSSLKPDEPNLSLLNLQLAKTNTGTNDISVVGVVSSVSADYDLKVRNCYIRGKANDDSGSSDNGFYLGYNKYNATAKYEVSNCIFTGCSSSSNSAAIMARYNTFDSVVIKNNIVYYDGGDASTEGVIYTSGDKHLLSGNLVIVAGTSTNTCYSGTFDASSDHNVSSDTTAPGTNTVQSFDHSLLFPNAATGDFRPAISYVSALGTTWGAGAIPWERDVVVDTSSAPTTDDFNRADGALGSNWSAATGIDELVIDSNAAHTPTASTTAVNYWNVTVPNDDQYVKGNLAEDAGLMLRLDPATSSGYIVTNRGTSLIIARLDNGVSTNLYNFSFTATISDIVEFDTVGATLRVFVNGTLECQAIDTTYSSGYVGIFSDELTGIVDNFEFGNEHTYSSLAAAEAGEQTIGDDLVLRNEKMVISCTSGGTTTADTSSFSFDSNWTSDTNCNISVIGEADGSTFKDDVYTYVMPETAVSELITVRVQNMYFRNIQFKGSSANNSNTYFIDAYSQALVIDGCFQLSIVSRNCGGVRLHSGTQNSIIKNSIYVGSYAPSYIPDTAYGTKTLNNLYYECGYGFYINATDNDNSEVSNTIIYNCFNDDYPYGDHGTYQSNLTNKSVAPVNDTTAIIDATFYDAAVDTLPVVPENCVIFKDILNNDFRLVSHKVENYKGEMVETNVAIGNGTWLYDVEDDCSGKSREPYDFKGVRTQRAFDIGAWQAPAQLTYVVDTDGVSGDYSNALEAITALNTDTTDMVASNLLPSIQLYNSTCIADTSDMDFAGTSNNTSEDCYPTIQGYDNYTFNPSSEVTFYTTLPFLIFKDFTIDAKDNTFYGLRIYGSISGVMIKNSSGNNARAFDIYPSALVENCIAYNVKNGGGNLGYGFGSSYAPNSTIKNCVAYDCSFGFSVGWNSNQLLLNNISIGNADFDFDTDQAAQYSASSDSNVSSDTSAANISGTNAITGLSSTYFKDPANGDFTPVASAGDLTSFSASANSTKTVGAIPYVDEQVVDTGGTGDYTSLSAWEAVAQSACVEGETARANCEASTGVADTTGVVINGFPTGVLVDVSGNNAFDGAINIYTLNYTGNDSVLQCIHHLVNISKLKVIANNAENYDGGILIDDTTQNSIFEVTVSDCLVDITASQSVNFGISVDDGAAGSYIKIENTTVRGSNSYGKVGIKFSRDNLNAICRNVTVYNESNSDSFAFNYSGSATTKVVLVDCAAYCADVSYASGFSAVSSNNVSSDATAPGAAPTINQDFTGDFVSTTDLHTTDSPYELWGADAAYAGAFGDEPYEVVRLVDTDGVSGDFTALDTALAWYKTNRADLVARNEKAVINCQATTDVNDVDVDFDGILTSEKSCIEINGDGDYTLEGVNYYAMIPRSIEYLYIDNLNFTSATYATFYPYGSDTVHNFISKCRFEVTGAIADNVSIPFGYNTFINCLFIKSGNDTSTYNFHQKYAQLCRLLNCTVYGGDFPIHNEHTRPFYVMNCVSFGDSLDYYGTFRGDNNLSSDISAPGANSLTNQVATDIFTDPAGGDFTLKAGSNAIGAGIDLSECGGFTTDIAGVTRTVPWDIGAFRYLEGTVLTTPADQDPSVAQPVTFNWNVYSGGTGIYHIQISTEDTFTSGLVVDDDTISTNSYTESTLLPNTLYYWRVSAEV